MCACYKGFQNDARCRLSDKQATAAQPLLDALKKIISGAAVIASSSNAPLTDTQTNDFLSTLQQLTDTSVTD